MLERQSAAVLLQVLLALSVALSAADVYATEESQSDATKPAESAAADVRVCKRVKTTGSRITQRVCMKQSEWAALAEESKRSMENRRYLESSTRIHADE